MIAELASPADDSAIPNTQIRDQPEFEVPALWEYYADLLPSGTAVLGSYVELWLRASGDRSLPTPAIVELLVNYCFRVDALRATEGSRSRKLGEVSNFLAVTYLAHGAQDLIGLLAASEELDLDAVLDRLNSAGISYWPSSWPLRGANFQPSICVSDGQRLVVIPVELSSLEKASASIEDLSGDKGFVLIGMAARPRARTGVELLPAPTEQIKASRGIEILRGRFGANLLLTWLANAYSVDNWASDPHYRSLYDEAREFEIRVSRDIQEMAGGEQPTSEDIVDSVIEQVRSGSDPLGRIALGDQLSKELMPAVYEQMMADAAEFRDGGGTWVQIAGELGVTPNAARKRLDPDARQRNAAEQRRLRAERTT